MSDSSETESESYEYSYEYEYVSESDSDSEYEYSYEYESENESVRRSPDYLTALIPASFVALTATGLSVLFTIYRTQVEVFLRQYNVTL